MKKLFTKATTVLLVMVLVVGMMSGCSSKKSDDQEDSTTVAPVSTTTDSSVTSSPAAPVTAFSDILWPDSMPTNPTLAESNDYAYDDMSQHYDLEFYTSNYGTEPPATEDDPIVQWLNKTFNVSVKFTTSARADMESVLSTRFSGGDVPDVVILPSKAFGFTLGEQKLLVDASEMYPYMPQTTKFVTKTILDWSTMDDGSIPFVTKYAIQDTDIWGLSIRQDWLDNLGMSMPKTIDDLLAYAHASTYDDPDGNGADDTYFMLGGGGGNDFGMLTGFDTWFGNPVDHAENGVLVSQYLNGNRKNYLAFLNKLYTDGTFTPDWFTIAWEDAKAYTLKDKIGMVNYPTGALYQEYANANAGDYSISSNWEFLDALPEGVKGTAGGNNGECIAVPASNVKENPGKLARICHILDAMCYGGDAYFATVQGGGSEVHEGYTADVREYLEDGTSYCYVDATHPGFTKYGTDNLALAPWQAFGYTLKWQKQYCAEDADDNYKLFVDKVNDGSAKLASYDRWPNDNLLLSVPADTAPNLKDYVMAQEYKFIVGDRSLDEWDTFVQEYLDQGGKDLLTAEANGLGCSLPTELQ